jgi:hypothetical protein
MHHSLSPGKTGAGAGRLGTFAGVFTPSLLTILGIILFLRLGYVVGNAGFWRSWQIVGTPAARPMAGFQFPALTLTNGGL